MQVVIASANSYVSKWAYVTLLTKRENQSLAQYYCVRVGCVMTVSMKMGMGARKGHNEQDD